MTYVESMIKKTDIPTAIKQQSAHYSTKILEVYEFVKKLGMIITNFDMNKFEFSFDYITSGRSTFDYAELLQLQRIIEPDAQDACSISVFGFKGDYTIRVRLPILAS